MNQHVWVATLTVSKTVKHTTIKVYTSQKTATVHLLLADIYIVVFSMKFETKPMPSFPPHLKCITILPCKTENSFLVTAFTINLLERETICVHLTRPGPKQLRSELG